MFFPLWCGCNKFFHLADPIFYCLYSPSCSNLTFSNWFSNPIHTHDYSISDLDNHGAYWAHMPYNLVCWGRRVCKSLIHHWNIWPRCKNAQMSSNLYHQCIPRMTHGTAYTVVCWSTGSQDNISSHIGSCMTWSLHPIGIDRQSPMFRRNQSAGRVPMT